MFSDSSCVLKNAKMKAVDLARTAIKTEPFTSKRTTALCKQPPMRESHRWILISRGRFPSHAAAMRLIYASHAKIALGGEYPRLHRVPTRFAPGARLRARPIPRPIVARHRSLLIRSCMGTHVSLTDTR